MSNNSTKIIKNIQEIICIIKNDFDSYSNILDQIIADIIKNSKYTEALITFINGQLANTKSRKKGLLLLQILLPLCPDQFIEENAIAWLNNSLKNCQSESIINNDAYKVIKQLLELCYETPELAKSVTSGIFTKLLESITKINFRDEESINALNCLETILKYYPGSGFPFKSSIEIFLLSFVDCDFSSQIVRTAGKCLHLMQQTGGGGIQGKNHKESWKNQHLTICATMQSIMDTLFESVMEMDHLQDENVSILDLPQLPVGEPMKLNSIRLINLSIFLQEMLLGAFPTPKFVSPTAILSIVSRGLAVTSSTIGKQLLTDAINLASYLHFVHKQLLHLLEALIICLGCNLIPYSGTICKAIINCLKTTKPKDADNVTAFCDLRVSTYQTLIIWAKTAKSSSCIHLFADSLIPIILTDVTPVTTELNLTVQTSTPKHMSKKARKKVQQEQIVQSSVAKNYSNFSRKTSTASNINQIRICSQALDTLQVILTNSGQFLKPVVHKQLQEFVIKMILNIQRDIIMTPYDNVNCKLSLYNTLTTLVTNHHWNMSPPLSYAIYLLSKGQTDSDIKISSCCTEALSTLNSFIHPSCPSIEYPINIEKLRNEFNEEEDKATTNGISDNENSDEADNIDITEADVDFIDNKVDDITMESESVNETKEIIEEEVSITTVEDKQQEITEENAVESTEETNNDDLSTSNTNEINNSEQNQSQIEISDDEIMDSLVLEDDAEVIDISEKEDVIKLNDNKTGEESKTNEIINLVEEDMLSSFADIVNE